MSNIKTVIAAGGLGTRLQGFRGNDSTKILLEVDGSPMIIRQIEQLTSWGLDEFVIITNPSFDKLIKDVVNSYFPDKKISFSIQLEQKGISHALLCAKEYIHHDDIVFFILGDNFFEYSPTKNLNLHEIGINKGAHIFSHKVDNPEEFGVAELDSNNNVISIEEKPDTPKSNQAVVGVYIYDDTVMDKIMTLKPSARGEYEVTDLNNLYIQEQKCKNVTLDGWWIDAGTPERIIELENKLT
ncbi:sugar phosphate nucleotidyltransferase [Acidimicrobiia bacterium]|nr:sugar phosphate nucleotidyltransferase [Acidimicrobiia bacterium]MDA9845627.1 sugar phosphate nucleotidyltransferase [Acidimicrobiia bacterium]MDB3891149.1 sugar phosphate nucleotidyltransferase [Acidimicrobiia bacterium]MDB3980575.1 sugar phosphate nucleotidyltransferase [Acidimicrobiia bacterium]